MAVRLSIQSLSLNHFRNYGQMSLEPNGGSVVLMGANGAGKTNILEAISLLIPGRGLRKARIGELQNQTQEEPWAVSAMVEGREGEVRIGTGLDPSAMDDIDRRLVRISGASMSPNALAEHFSCLWLTPQMDGIFIESSGTRRRFFDRLVFSFDSAHSARVNQYETAMRERNKLLERGQADARWLDSLEVKMAESSVAIAAARLHTLENLTHAMESTHSTFPHAALALSGFAEDRLQTGDAALAVEQALAEKFAQNRAYDAASGRAQEGAHKTELSARHVEKNMAAEYCSTGEQKALLLSIILAQAKAGALWEGIIPVLLLDEVVAHLDATRRAALFSEIAGIGAQTWLTGTDEGLFEGIGGETLKLRVDDGRIS